MILASFWCVMNNPGFLQKSNVVVAIIVFVAIFAMLPSLLLFVGVEYFAGELEKEKLNEASVEVDQYFAAGKAFLIDPEKNWARLFFSWKKDLQQLNDPAKFLDEKRSLLGQTFEYAIWNKDDSEPKFSPAFPIKKFAWKNLWILLYRLLEAEIQRDLNAADTQPLASKNDWQMLQSFFGPQINLYKIQTGLNSESNLIWADFTGSGGVWWGFVEAKSSVRGLVYLEIDSLSDEKNLKTFCEQSLSQASKLKLDLFAVSMNGESNDQLRHKILQFVKNPDTKLTRCFLHNETYYFPEKLGNRVFCVAIERKQLASSSKFGSYGIVFVYLCCFAPFLIGFYHLQMQGRTFFISISWKVAFLFFYAAGIPLLILGFCARDFLDKRRTSLVESVSRKGRDVLREFDRSFLVGISQKEVKVQAEVDRFRRKIREEGAKWEIFREFMHRVKPIEKNVSLDQALFVGPEEWTYDRYGVIVGENYVKLSEKREITGPIQLFGVIGRGFIRMFNKESISKKESYQMEFIFDTLFRRQSHIVFNEIMENRRSIFKFGFGNSYYPVYLDIFSLDDNPRATHFLFIIWPENVLQIEFLQNQILSANRNIDSFKIVAVANRFEEVVFPETYSENPQLNLFSKRVSEAQNFRSENLSLDGISYLSEGFKAKNIEFFNLFYLYPIEKIDGEIAKLKKELIFTGAVSALVATLLAIVLANVFLLPLRELTAGIAAIKKRKFDYRVKVFSDDEFGSLTKILNVTMIDLEELNVAGIVQKKLNPASALSQGGFTVFGHTTPLGDLGGDYYDYFPCSEGKFSVLIGDVAGHGVGAALIMAMAKAGTIFLGKRMEDPLQSIQELHHLVLAAKNKKQKKFMTMQLFCFDVETAVAKFCNAGGCFPLFYNKEVDRLIEIDLQGSALGMFQKASFQEKEVQFSSGDAMVLYTDGVIEVQNPSGEVLGYQRFKEFVKDSYDVDTEAFYNRLFARYVEFVDEREANDDVTFLIVVYNPEECCAKS